MSTFKVKVYRRRPLGGRQPQAKESLRAVLRMNHGAVYVLCDFVMNQFEDQAQAKRFEAQLAAGELPDLPKLVMTAPPAIIGLACNMLAESCQDVRNRFVHNTTIVDRVTHALYSMGQIILSTCARLHAERTEHPVVSL